MSETDACAFDVGPVGGADVAGGAGGGVWVVEDELGVLEVAGGFVDVAGLEVVLALVLFDEPPPELPQPEAASAAATKIAMRLFMSTPPMREGGYRSPDGECLGSVQSERFFVSEVSNLEACGERARVITRASDTRARTRATG
jgi:hypothetical protein